MNFSDLDFSMFQDIPPVQRYYDTPRVSVTEKGLVSMNGAFRKEVGAQREFRIRVSPDGRYLLFNAVESPDIHFSEKSGSVTHLKLAAILKGKGILLPAAYTMNWYQERQVWVGCCEELPQPPDISTLMKDKKRTGKKRDT